MATQTGSIDLKAHVEAHDAASQTASKYITEVNNDGIMVHPDGEGPNDTATPTGWHIGAALEYLKQGIARFWIGLKNSGDITPTVRIGASNESHVEIDYHSLQFIDKESSTYFYVSDLREEDGTFEASDSFTGADYDRTDGITLSYQPVQEANTTSVFVNGTEYAYHSGDGAVPDQAYWFNGIAVLLNPKPEESDTIQVDYLSADSQAKAFTFGSRVANSKVGRLSAAIGELNRASGEDSAAFGNLTTASGMMSFASGRRTTASGSCSHVEGVYSTASGINSHAEGYETEASGDSSHSEGYNTVSSGAHSHAEGYGTTASGQFSHTEGVYTTASALYSHAEGLSSTASNTCTHAEGTNTTSSGGYSHSEGGYTVASGGYSHAEGHDTTASGNYSHAQNVGTAAGYEAQTAIGKYNDNNSDNAFEVGNGTADNARSNALAVDWSGNVRSDGSIVYLDNGQGETRTYLQAVEETTYNRTRLGTHRKVGNTDVYNNLNLTIDTSGNRSVGVSEVAPWLDMLGLAVSDTTMTVSTTNAGSISNNNVRRSGKVVTVQFTGLTLKSSLSNGTTSATLATIPSGYRPSWNVYFPPAVTSNVGSSYFRIDSSGNLTLRNQSDSAMGTSLNFAATVTYVIA